MPLTAHNGIDVPSFMYGTAWKKDATARLVEAAIGAGFRALDTANQLIHYNEAGVGEALETLGREGIGREALFIQTKFTPLGGQGGTPPYDPAADLPTQVRQSFDSSLMHLRTDTIDSYVLHAPYSRRGLGAADRAVWSAMEELYASGKSKMIGVSNITAPQLEQLCAEARVRPMMVQNRCFAVLGWDHEVRGICRNRGIIYQGFSLLTANQDVLVDARVGAIARRLRVGPAQVVFAFARALNMLPLTGTTNRQHMEEDLKAERLALLPEEIEYIENIAL